MVQLVLAKSNKGSTSFASRFFDFLTDLLKVLIQLVLDDGMHCVLQRTSSVADQAI